MSGAYSILSCFHFFSRTSSAYCFASSMNALNKLASLFSLSGVRASSWLVQENH
uniref:Uncharacterized protein n=1 Tax=Picea glauca TaxID=3330 RepID=A0A101M401_PICGL|nr:hypothetical protein ABT39_MTgene495 [Picea glauca]